MGVTPLTLVGGALAGALFSGLQAKNQQEDTSRAYDQAAQASDRLYAQQQKEMAKANAKSPDTGALFARNEFDGQQAGGTMLTGPTGVDPALLALGKNSLLGGAG